MANNFREKDWLTLDNAAKIYPATSTRRSPPVFRLTAILHSPIKLWKLQEALERLIPRFPYFQVYLHRGFFWYYLQRHQEIPEIKPMQHVGLSDLPIRRKTAHLLEISVRENKISVDFSHVLTDGKGGFRFLTSLIAEYLRNLGNKIKPHENILIPEQVPQPDEFIDAHRFFFKSGMPKPPKLNPAFHLKDKQLYHRKFRIITGCISTEKFISLTRQKGATITEFLTALYIYSLSEVYQDYIRNNIKPGSSIIRLEVPVDMRKIYPSVTMRNFSLYVSPEIDLKLGHYSFTDILKKVHHSLGMQLDDKELNRQISRNVSAELNPIIRIIPLFIKDLYLSRLYSRLGERIYSGVLSNLGKINLPDTMVDEIEDWGFIVHPNHVMKKSCSVISYGDRMKITISSVIKKREFERKFFKKLRTEGIPVHIEEE